MRQTKNDNLPIHTGLGDGTVIKLRKGLEMKRFGYLLGAMAVFGFALMVPSVVADEPKADHGHGHEHGDGHDHGHAGHGHKDGDEHSQDAMHEAMMKMQEPGPQHAKLKEAVGTWNAELKHWMGPGEPVIGKGKSVVKSIMGGRYIQEDFTSEFDGKPFHGRGIYGYDNAKQKYVSVWFDDMSTGFMPSEGTYDEATKTTTYVGGGQMMPGMEYKTRMVDKEIDKDKHVFEMYMTMPGQPEMKTMEITYTRDKTVANAE